VGAGLFSGNDRQGESRHNQSQREQERHRGLSENPDKLTHGLVNKIPEAGKLFPIFFGSFRAPL
jgi:hypothetical protein